jgi:hypothetical protein
MSCFVLCLLNRWDLQASRSCELLLRIRSSWALSRTPSICAISSHENLIFCLFGSTNMEDLLTQTTLFISHSTRSRMENLAMVKLAILHSPQSPDFLFLSATRNPNNFFLSAPYKESRPECPTVRATRAHSFQEINLTSLFKRLRLAAIASIGSVGVRQNTIVANSS